MLRRIARPRLTFLLPTFPLAAINLLFLSGTRFILVRLTGSYSWKPPTSDFRVTSRSSIVLGRGLPWKTEFPLRKHFLFETFPSSPCKRNEKRKTEVKADRFFFFLHLINCRYLDKRQAIWINCSRPQILHIYS